MQLPNIIEFKGQRVLMTWQLAQCYETTRHIISNNFTRNKGRYTIGKHYIPLEGDALQDFKRCNQFDDTMKKTSILYLWTEKGALLHAKSLNTDKAWEVYDYLVDFYFRAKEERKVPVTVDTKTEAPTRRPPMMTVVDAPENPQIQSAMEEVKKYLTTIEVFVKEANTYCTPEKYERIMGCLDIFWTGLGHKILNLAETEPKQVTKHY